MNEDRQSGASELLSKGASAAQAVHGAVKTGKAVAALAKGATAGGPYGAAAMAIWENRELVIKIVIAAACITALPFLFVLMLPSLIFGGLKSEKTLDIPVMNNNAAIYANIENVNSRVYGVLTASHDAVLAEIQNKIDKLDSDSEHEIIDSFSKDAAFDTNILISQYCASKDSYEDIDTDDLVSIIEKHKGKLFSFTETVETKEITRQTEVEVEKIVTEYIDSIVTDDDGNTRTVKVPVQRTVKDTEIQEETLTVTMHTYTVSFVGAEYFANEIFKLDEEKAATAGYYAQNLVLFLDERDSETVAANGTHRSISDLLRDDNTPFVGGDFADVIENWKAHVTSEFGWREDPITKKTSYHSGIDIGIGTGTPIYAAADGTVLYTKKLSTGYGWHVVINHGGKVTTLYAHCSELLVKDGDTVEKGDVIAKVGSTGRSTGPHLHMEVQVDGVLKNPREYLK